MHTYVNNIDKMPTPSMKRKHDKSNYDDIVIQKRNLIKCRLKKVIPNEQEATKRS